MKSVYVKSDVFGRKHKDFFMYATASLTPLALDNFIKIVQDEDYSQKSYLRSIIGALRPEIAYPDLLDRFINEFAPWAGE